MEQEVFEIIKKNQLSSITKLCEDTLFINNLTDIINNNGISEEDRQYITVWFKILEDDGYWMEMFFKDGQSIGACGTTNSGSSQKLSRADWIDILADALDIIFNRLKLIGLNPVAMGDTTESDSDENIKTIKSTMKIRQL